MYNKISLSFKSLENSLIRKKAQKLVIKIIVSIVRYLFLIAVGYIVLYPLFYMVSASLKPAGDFIDPSVVWIPKALSVESYKIAFEALDFGKSLFSTLTLQIFSAFIEIFVCLIVAYGFARFRLKEKKILYVFLILSILVPTPMIIIPLMDNFKNLDFLGIFWLLGKITSTELRPDLLNTPFAFYLPSLLGVGLRSGIIIFICIQFFKGLPKELEEAAYIDGANPLKTYFRVIVPSSGVAILTVTIFSVIWHWNEYFQPVMFLSEKYPLAVSLSEISGSLEGMGHLPLSSFTQGIIMAACVIFIAPMLVLYLILQKWFIASIDRIGIVG